LLFFEIASLRLGLGETSLAFCNSGMLPMEMLVDLRIRTGWLLFRCLLRGGPVRYLKDIFVVSSPGLYGVLFTDI